MAKMATVTLDTGNELIAAVSQAALASETRTATTLRFTQIRTNGGTQMRQGTNDQVAAEYADELRRDVVLPPVVVFFDGTDYWLGDGFHRVRAHYMAYGSDSNHEIPADVRPGTRRDAILFAAQANAVHGLRRTNADKRRAVETLLRDEEWALWSDREIARRCAVSNRFVGDVRAELTPVAAQEPTGDTVNGTQYERTYTHPKTGQTTTMKVGNIGGQRNAVGKCKVCKRPLTDPASVNGACGPVCAAKLAAGKEIVVVDQELPTLRPLTVEETVAVIYRLLQRNVTAAQGQQAAQTWVATHFKIDDYLEVINQNEVYILPAIFHDAYGRVQVEMELVRPAQPVVEVATMPAPATPATPTRNERLSRLLDLYRQVAASASEYGQLTGDFTSVLPLRRALEPMIAKLIGNQVEEAEETP